MSPRRRKRRGEKPPALLSFDHGQLVAEVDTGDNPRVRPCPFCRATKGNPCTTPRGNRMSDYHDSRKNPSEAQPSTPYKDPCEGKKRFSSYDEAGLALVDSKIDQALYPARNGNRHEQRVYYCGNCNGFHLTSRPDRQGTTR